MTWTHVDDGTVCLADRAGAITNDGTDWCLAHDRKVANAVTRCWMCGATPGQYHAKACSVDGLMPGPGDSRG